MDELITKKIELNTDIKLSFWERDLKYYLDMLDNPNNIDIQWINSLFVDKANRGKGVATNLLNKFCSEHKNSLILLQAGVSCKEYKDEPSEEEIVEIINGLVKFYSKRGFVDINEYIGCYENSCIMLYKNKTSEILLNLLENIFD